jgi:hypothetical protein
MTWALVLWVCLPDGQVNAYPFPSRPSASACVASINALSAGYVYTDIPEGAIVL